MLDLNHFNNKLFVISAPSGTGKTTILNHLKNEIPINKVTTNTTRSPRNGEINGVDYYFNTKEEFEHLINNNLLLEYANVYGNYYGSLISSVAESLKHKNSFLIVDTQGAKTIKRKVKGAVYIFLLPPSFKELKRRLISRNTESEDNINKRLNAYKSEIENCYIYDYIIKCVDINTSVFAVKSIVIAETYRFKKGINYEI